MIRLGPSPAQHRLIQRYEPPQQPPKPPPGPRDEFTPATYTVAPGDSWYRIAQNLATEQLAAQGLSPSDPSYSETWHRLVVQLVGELQAANGDRPLHPGDVLLLPGAAPTPEPAPGPIHTPVTGDYGAIFVNQLAGDPDGRNGNCGFTSSLMALRALGIDTSQLGGTAYQQAMRLRYLGGGGTNDRAWGTCTQVVNALTAAGANARMVPSTWGANKLAAVDFMRQQFLSGQPTSFVVAGNPALGWPDRVSYSGGHFVTVAGYDPATDTFTVLDPISRGPMQVTPQQLAAYLRDTNAEQGEVIQVTPR